MKFKVGSKLVGEDEPCFIIAENGNNHAGSFENALKIIKIAAECGANAVTFQHTPIDSYVIKSFYNDARVAYLKDCELTTEQLMLLKAEANKFRLAFSLNFSGSNLPSLVRQPKYAVPNSQTTSPPCSR